MIISAGLTAYYTVVGIRLLRRIADTSLGKIKAKRKLKHVRKKFIESPYLVTLIQFS